MDILTTHRKRTLNDLSKVNEVQYIIYNLKTKNLSPHENIDKINDKFFNEDANYQFKNEILLFIKDMANENARTTLNIIEAIKNSSFSVSQRVEEELIHFIKNKPTYDFIKNENEIINHIQKSMKSKTSSQAKKYYNNISLRIKFTRIDLLEKTLEEKEDNFKKSIKRRDKLNKIKPKLDEVEGANEHISTLM